MKRLLFLYNPKSGDGRVRAHLAEIVEIMTAQGFTVTVHPTACKGDAQEQIIAEGKSYSQIVAAGGDGMLHEAVNGLAGIDFSRRLGYIPTGTVNDFANTHEIPLKIAEAAATAISPALRQIDLGVFNHEYFAYVAACGIMTNVSYETSQIDKKRLGSMAYVINGMTSVDYTHWENNATYMDVKWEGGSASGDFVFCAVSNSEYIGGSTQFADNNFSWDDGLLEGLLIRVPKSLMDLNVILGGIVTKNFSSSLFVKVQSPWFEIHSDLTGWTLDGEYGGDHTDVYIRTAGQALLLSSDEAGE
ncbi:MAG: YegS/Rv2252/BmrU family lipid kinase [Erysipelotrichaceae bacterium]|nr:YegS/Rv2252/BmrU family lipid kinase [Erysipelotrichaceae bacterium]